MSNKYADLDVRDFGAVVDGLTDDTAAFRAALDAAAASGRNLYIPKGVMRVYPTTTPCPALTKIAATVQAMKGRQ